MTDNNAHARDDRDEIASYRSLGEVARTGDIDKSFLAIDIRDRFEGIPLSIAERLAERYDSVQDVRDAPRDELLDIDGVGKRRVFAIKDRESDLLWERSQSATEGELLPVREGDDGVLRLPCEVDDDH